MSLPPDLTELADTYPLPSNATFKAGITKFLNYAKGLLGATGNAAEARNALGIGPVISFRNLLINGNFAINQRVYASGTATTGANQYTLDRWRIPTTGQNAAFGAAAPDRTVTAPASGLEQVVEGANIVGGVYTLSWVGSGTAKVNGVAVANGGQTGVLPANTNVVVQFVGAVSLAQLELGTVATPFERRSVGLEMFLCQRYYLLFSGGGGGVCTSSGAEYTIFFQTPMRVAPTYVNGGNGAIVDGLGVLTVTGGSAAGLSQTNARLSVAASGATAGRGANVVNQTSLFSAEL